MQDQRAAPRQEVKIPGRLFLPDGSVTLECWIVDISDGGARIRTELGLVLPDRVYLWRGDTADIFDCEVRWQLAKDAGLLVVDRCGRQMRRALIVALPTAEHSSRVARWMEAPQPTVKS